MSRSLRLASLVLLAHVSHVHAQASDSESAERARCAAVRVVERTQFQGRTLIEIPDVTDPRMRLANALLSSRCYQEAVDLIRGYGSERGEDAQVLYVAARYVWIHSGAQAAEEFLDHVIGKYPEFASAKVLLAGVRIDQRRLEDARSLLDGVRAATDLWAYLDRLRVDALTGSDTAIATLLTIAKDSQFPPNAREVAANDVQQSHVSVERVEDAYRALLTFESATPLDCKLSNYATWLTEGVHRFEDARKLLETYVQTARPCSSLSRSRMLLAYVYLVEASELDLNLSSRNSALVQRARALVNDDFGELSRWLVGRPLETRLSSLIANHVEVKAVDAHGGTQICRGVMLLNVATVFSELETGADPNGNCETVSLVERVIMMAITDRVTQRQGVVRLLLEHGARVTKKDLRDCAETVGLDCATTLLPILQQYLAPR